MSEFLLKVVGVLFIGVFVAAASYLLRIGTDTAMLIFIVALCVGMYVRSEW